VVAKVVQALSADNYERRPKAKRHIGRRKLTDDEQARRLGQRLTSFFDGTAPEADDEDTSALENAGWRTQLVCFNASAGGLCLEVGPLVGLPAFVKKLRVVGSQDWDGFVLAANARMRSARVPVSPETGPWRWEAVGFEEEDLGFEKLSFEGLDASTPIVFRVDADGLGQHIKSTTLSLGQAYRLLLSPGVGASVGVELNHGWRIWSIDLATQISPATRRMLASLRLDVGEAWPCLAWALSPAAAWRTNARGNSYPVFEAGAELLVNVSGIEADESDEAIVFLHGPTGTERLPLSSNGLVSLGVPAPGRWACALKARTCRWPSPLKKLDPYALLHSSQGARAEALTPAADATTICFRGWVRTFSKCRRALTASAAASPLQFDGC